MFKYEPDLGSVEGSSGNLFDQFTAHTSSLSGRQFARMLRQWPIGMHELAAALGERGFTISESLITIHVSWGA